MTFPLTWFWWWLCKGRGGSHHGPHLGRPDHLLVPGDLRHSQLGPPHPGLLPSLALRPQLHQELRGRHLLVDLVDQGLHKDVPLAVQHDAELGAGVDLAGGGDDVTDDGRSVVAREEEQVPVQGGLALSVQQDREGVTGDGHGTDDPGAVDVSLDGQYSVTDPLAQINLQSGLSLGLHLAALAQVESELGLGPHRLSLLAAADDLRPLHVVVRVVHGDHLALVHVEPN